MFYEMAQEPIRILIESESGKEGFNARFFEQLRQVNEATIEMQFQVAGRLLAQAGRIAKGHCGSGDGRLTTPGCNS
jgi:hypothetical protein